MSKISKATKSWRPSLFRGESPFHSRLKSLFLLLLLFTSSALLWRVYAVLFVRTAEQAVCVVLGEVLLGPLGNASTNLRPRIRTAMKISKQNGVQNVIFSGGDTAKVGTSEAAVMKELWLEQESTAQSSVQFFLEEKSFSTCQNAYYSLPILKHLQARVVFVVTSDFHQPRAQLLFEQVFRTVDQSFLARVETFGATTQTNRTSLFANERNWLRPPQLEVLLTQMPNHPFLLPDATRIQQAVVDLDRIERHQLIYKG